MFWATVFYRGSRPAEKREGVIFLFARKPQDRTLLCQSLPMQTPILQEAKPACVAGVCGWGRAKGCAQPAHPGGKPAAWAGVSRWPTGRA